MLKKGTIHGKSIKNSLNKTLHPTRFGSHNCEFCYIEAVPWVWPLAGVSQRSTKRCLVRFSEDCWHKKGWGSLQRAPAFSLAIAHFALLCGRNRWWIRTRDTLIKRLGNAFRLKSPFLNLTTADFSEESGCHFSSPLKPIIALFS